MLDGQLSFLATPKEHYTAAGMLAAGWASIGQFYDDLRRHWALDPDLELTGVQMQYLVDGG